MSDTLFSLHSWPQAIIHIDGDAFFTSCEEAIHPELRGKPVSSLSGMDQRKADYAAHIEKNEEMILSVVRKR